MTEDGPRLSRRDALAALAAGGLAVGGGAAALRWGPTVLGDDSSFGPAEIETLVAVAEVVYPSAVTGIEAFVEAYSVGRVRTRPIYAAGVADAVTSLDTAARDWFGGRFADLALDTRQRVLRELAIADAEPDPDGIGAERIRYYLVNELLYALYTSPTGGRLVGLDNPQGHPGGLGSYQRGPEP